jgi:hypothetical protein
MIINKLDIANFMPNGIGMPVNNGNTFFESVNYIGAFKDANDDWTKGWTFAY